jgi:hypothetical protein
VCMVGINIGYLRLLSTKYRFDVVLIAGVAAQEDSSVESARHLGLAVRTADQGGLQGDVAVVVGGLSLRDDHGNEDSITNLEEPTFCVMHVWSFR